MTPTTFTDDPRFTGSVSGADFIPSTDTALHAFVVSFEVNSRTAWHSHANGQLLICISGHGFVGTRDGQQFELSPGRAVWTEPGEEHWHGASQHSGMTHLAVQTRPRDGQQQEVDWREPVTDEEAKAE